MEQIPPSATPTEFEDFDELTAALVGWNLELTQIDRGSFRGRTAQVSSANSLLSYARFGRLLHQRGAPPPGVWTFGVPAPGCPEFTWRKERVSPGDVVVMRPGTELDAISRDGFAIFTFSVPEAHLTAVAEQTDLPFEPLAAPAGVLRGPGVRARALMRRMTACFRRPLADDTAGSLDTDLTCALLEAMHEPVAPARPRADEVRKDAFERARTYVAASEQEPLTVARLCRAIGVSERTLRRAFGEALGVAPKAYLVAQRMNGVRRLLRAASSEPTTVIEAANRFGFWHMGQFAADYRRQFGERPSETMARARAAS